MTYGKVDELAINTIRTLAVRQRLPLLPLTSPTATPLPQTFPPALLPQP